MDAMTVKKIEFWVEGIPKGQPRPRAFVRGNRAAVYDPGTAENWKSRIATASLAHRPSVPLAGPLTVSIRFLLPRPKSLCRKRDADGVILAPNKPDCDNLAKAVLDAMTQIGWWHDDRQVTDLFSSKRYHEKTGRPGAMISILFFNERSVAT